MSKSISDIESDKDDATGGYEKFRMIRELTENDIREYYQKHAPLHTVHHVDMDAILTGREKRLSIEDSMNRGAELCVEFMKEIRTRQSDQQTVEVKEMEGFTRDDSIEF